MQERATFDKKSADPDGPALFSYGKNQYPLFSNMLYRICHIRLEDCFYIIRFCFTLNHIGKLSHLVLLTLSFQMIYFFHQLLWNLIPLFLHSADNIHQWTKLLFLMGMITI